MNRARIALGIIGGLALVVGLIVTFAQKAAAERASFSAGYLNVLEGGSPDAPVPVDYTGMWVGVVIAVVGALMLIALLVAVAATPKAPPETLSGEIGGRLASSRISAKSEPAAAK